MDSCHFLRRFIGPRANAPNAQTTENTLDAILGDLSFSCPGGQSIPGRVCGPIVVRHVKNFISFKRTVDLRRSIFQTFQIVKFGKKCGGKLFWRQKLPDFLGVPLKYKKYYTQTRKKLFI